MAQKIVETQLAAAEALGRDLLETTPRAAAEARYDRATGRVTIDLTNGCAYAFLTKLVEDLSSATDEQLATVVVDGLGFNLHWATLDADLYVPALVSGVFGTQSWMTRELARRAGQAAAARVNGAKGGRPPRKTRHAFGTTLFVRVGADELDEGDRPTPIERHHHPEVTACHREPDPLAAQRLGLREIRHLVERTLPRSRCRDPSILAQRGPMNPVIPC